MAKEITDFLGKTYKSVSEMCREHNIPLCTYMYRLKKGMTSDDALRMSPPTKYASKNGKKITDHTGKEWNSVQKMIEYYGISRNTYYRRVYLGWDIEKILTKKPNYTKKAS